MKRAVAVALAGCYAPSAPAGAPCSEDGACPSGLVCTAGACIVPGTAIADAPVDVAVDAAPLDAPPAFTFTPSNGVDKTQVDGLVDSIVLSGDVTFHGDSGEIDGDFTRASGTGVKSGIGYQRTASGYGVFAFAKLVVTDGALVELSGTKSVVFLVGDKAIITGAIEAKGGNCGGAFDCAGPGGGQGGVVPTKPSGCGPGGLGGSAADNSDAGGGGGGGGSPGGAGGTSGTTAGGAGGTACVAAALEPLSGGSGGAGGGVGATTPAHGGGGGGALQITAMGSLAITGTIDVGGGGGENGYADTASTSNAGGGGGGGAGGGLLLEAPTVNLGASSILAANGGGGGGAGHGATSGLPGASGQPSATTAAGGQPGMTPSGGGGDGAAGAVAAEAAIAVAAGNNAGGGGGGGGRIFVRAMLGAPNLAGVQSPKAGTGAVKP